MFSIPVLKRLAMLTVFVLALLVLAPTQTSLGATSNTYTVTSSADSGPGTLRQAIIDANNHAGADTININALPPIVIASQLLVTDDVTIVGAGQGSTFVDGNNATRVFNFAYNSGTHSMSNLTIRNGNCGNCDDVRPGQPLLNGGGGIFNEGVLTLTNVTVTNSSATQGGGIFNAYATGNYVPSLTLNGVSLLANSQVGTVFGQGGGGLFNGGTITANGLTINGNSAYSQGAGFYNNSFSNVTISNFTISGNTAREGAGINTDVSGSSTVTLNNGTISGNVTNCCHTQSGANTGGAGIYNNETMVLNDVTVSNNIANNSTTGAPPPGSFGGGILNLKSMTLNRVTLSGNKATYGGAIYNGGSNTLSATNVTISGNEAFPAVAGIGGALFQSGAANATFLNVTISANTAFWGGGIDSGTNNPTGVVSLKNTILADNTITGAQGPDCRGPLTTQGYNLLKSTVTCGFTPTTGDQVGVSASLGALANNGGPTQTMAISPSSKAYDKGTNNGCPATDQRGNSRPQGASCDIGAYEYTVLVVKPSILLPMILQP